MDVLLSRALCWLGRHVWAIYSHYLALSAASPVTVRLSAAVDTVVALSLGCHIANRWQLNSLTLIEILRKLFHPSQACIFPPNLHIFELVQLCVSHFVICVI